MNQPKETLNFKITLSGTYWDKVPAYSVLLDSVLFAQGSATKEPITVEFTTDVDEDKEHILEIRLENKNDSDTVENEDKTAIVKDLLLNIDKIEIDEIDIAALKWLASEFIADDADRPLLKNCVNLGWNGSYKLKFSSPFYLWLLENM
jgi:hypothetical protein